MSSDLGKNKNLGPKLTFAAVFSAVVLYLLGIYVTPNTSTLFRSTSENLPLLLPFTVPVHSSVGYQHVFRHMKATFPDKTSIVVHNSTLEFGELTHNFWKNVSESVWESSTFTAFKHCISKSAKPDVIDFGSWIGPTVLYAAALGAAQVVSFEPDPAAFAELQVNVGLNGFSHVKLHQACIGPKRGPLTLYYRDGSSVSSTTEVEHDYFNVTHEFTVHCYKLSDVLAQYHQVSNPLFIKIDTEGFEVDLLPTLHGVFQTYKPAVHLSIHPMLREFGAAEYKAVCNAVTLFPRKYIVTHGEHGGSQWKLVKMKNVKECMEVLKGNVFEMLLTWNEKQCSGVNKA